MLNGIQFNSKCIIVEEAKSKPTHFSRANILRPTAPIFSKHLRDKNYHCKFPISSAIKVYCVTVNL